MKEMEENQKTMRAVQYKRYGGGVASLQAILLFHFLFLFVLWKIHKLRMVLLICLIMKYRHP
jgi:hypothetical protein